MNKLQVYKVSPVIHQPRYDFSTGSKSNNDNFSFEQKMKDNNEPIEQLINRVAALEKRVTELENIQYGKMPKDEYIPESHTERLQRMLL